MKKLVALTMALVLTLAFGYVTMASTIGIGANEGLTVEVAKQVDPSEDGMWLNGYYGVNNQLQLSLGYHTETKDKELGARYAFAENMAVTLNHTLADAEGASDTTVLGFRYKKELSDALAMVGVLSYSDADEMTEMGIQGQAEYKFANNVVGNLGFQYGSPDIEGLEVDSYTNIVAGIEVSPIENVSAYLDYTMVDEDVADDDTIDLGVSYSF